MIVGRFFVEARMRARTIYALTNRRAIIISGIVTRGVKSVDLRTTSEIGFSESPGGIGTITFGPASPWLQGRRSSRSLSPQFEFLEAARTVYEKVKAIQRQSD